MDVHTTEQRRFNMSRVKSRDTRPELILRKALHAAGLRYRLHAKHLPGRPDIVFPGRKAAVFVHGCFWHGHDCPKAKLPATRPEFWREKITANQVRDEETRKRLQALGWRSLEIWECELHGRRRLPLEVVVERVTAFRNCTSSTEATLREG
ncbi:very short patch repair endonuclease [Caulobacter segnis]|uniref:very short patch repair endonuclease n=1 Tax=Caulobacter segnis TaxID=88688 RepID=UPI00240FB1F1|nr:very short patch repair endonuclease [Caulobacter segnis]MDG2520523.1 very short patch repair endonuclease [Caulobacter segnis]